MDGRHRSWSPGRKNTTEITTVGNGAALQGPGVSGEGGAGRTGREWGPAQPHPEASFPGHSWTKGLRQAWDRGPPATTGPGVIKMLWRESFGFCLPQANIFKDHYFELTKRRVRGLILPVRNAIFAANNNNKKDNESNKENNADIQTHVYC